MVLVEDEYSQSFFSIDTSSAKGSLIMRDSGIMCASVIPKSNFSWQLLANTEKYRGSEKSVG